MASRPATSAPQAGDADPPGRPGEGPERPREGPASEAGGRRRPRPIVVTLGLLVLVALPVLTALVVLHSPRWYPIGDLAQTELRVREVGTVETPLVGLAGRIGPPEDPGHHPGPLSFYALTPGYRLLGSSPFALQAASAGLSLLAVGLAIGLARRRGGWLFALGTAAVLAVLVRSLGPRVLTEPWNPYMPVLWWVVVLLATWSVWCDDDAMLPVAVGAACLASQTHVPYAGLVAVVLGATAVRLAWRAVRARRSAHRVARAPSRVRFSDRPEEGSLATDEHLATAPRVGSGPLEDDAGLDRVDAERSGISMATRHHPRPVSGRAVLLAAVVGVVAWIPPMIDELTGDPGNITVIVRYFLGSEGEPVGLRAGGSLWLSRLDPFTLLTRSLDGPVPGNRVLGALFLVVWAAAAAVAWRRRDTALVRLHQVTGLAALAGLASMTRIYGALHYYLVLWAWSTTAVAVLAVAATAARALGVPTVRAWPGSDAAADRERRGSHRATGGAEGSSAVPVSSDGEAPPGLTGAGDDVAIQASARVGRRVGPVSGVGPGQTPSAAVRRGAGPDRSAPAGGRGGRPGRGSGGSLRAGMAAAGIGAVVLVLASAVATVQALDASQSSPLYSEALAEVTPPTLAALEQGDVPGGGDGAYEVRADDPYVIGVQAYGLFTELLRAGVDARLPARLESAAGDHIVGPDESLPVIVVATGPQVEVWRNRPEAVEVAAADPRSPEDARRQEELITGVQERLRALGRPGQADQVEQNLLVLAVDGDIPGDVRQALSDIVDLGAPTAVFVTPAGTP